MRATFPLTLLAFYSLVNIVEGGAPCTVSQLCVRSPKTPDTEKNKCFSKLRQQQTPDLSFLHFQGRSEPAEVLAGVGSFVPAPRSAACRVTRDIFSAETLFQWVHCMYGPAEHVTL